MKKFILLSLVSLLLMGIVSCEDSLGIDPKVVRVNNNDGQGGSSFFRIDDISLSFSEFYMFPYISGYSIAENPWNNFCKILYKDITLDTTKPVYKLNIRSLQIKSIMPDSVYDHIAQETVKNKVVYCELRLDSIPLIDSKTDTLNGGAGSGRFCLVRIKTLDDGSLTDYTGVDYKMTCTVVSNNKTDKYIVLFVKSFLPEEYQKVIMFNFQIILNY